jgi:YD repeat-containing protein
VPWGDVAFTTVEYDAAGNITATRNWSGQDKLVNGKFGGWAVLEHKRNARGEMIELIYQALTPEGALNQLGRRIFAYDDFGHLIDSKNIGPESSRTQWARDDLGNILEKRLVDLEGQPIPGNDGWSIARYSHTPIASPPGWREEMSLFDTKGEKAWHKSGRYHRFISEFSATGDLRRVIREDQNPAPFGYYRLVSEPEFDAQKRLRKQVWRKEDKEGKRIRGMGALGLVEQEFDDKARPISEWQFDADTEPFGPQAWHIRTEWHSNGERKRRVRQACDAERKPLAHISNGKAARTEEEYKESGRLERIHETGIDEKLIGFTSCEAKFSEDILQSVTHARGDGTRLEAVQIFVTALTPKEPKAAEFKTGDALVSANGEAVRSAYQFYFSVFPGGWIEVRRAGQTVRIEGLAAGKLPVTLADRAPTN